MSAKVNTEFKKGFELNEESIRRIYADLKKRIPPEKHQDIIFEVFREDSLVYRTTEIARILTEDNDSTRKIKSLNFYYVDDSLDIGLEFDVNNGAEMTIEGEDRDTVYLISSELREYIEKEVACIQNFQWLMSTPTIFLIFIGIFIAMTMFQHSTPLGDQELKTLLDGTDTNEKLNYLINAATRTESLTRNSFFVFFPIVAMILFILPFGKIVQYLLPSNIFCIGKQTTLIKNRRNFTKNLFWCGLVGLIIAFGSGYYFLWVAKPLSS